MTPNRKAFLVAEIGSVTTRVTLVGIVAGETRLISQAEVPSTVEAPFSNPTLAIFQAVQQIAELSGRRLVEDNRLIMPQTSEQDGVDAVLAFTSAAQPLALVIATLSYNLSGLSALRAARGVNTQIHQVLTPSVSGRGEAAVTTDSWIEQQMETLLSLRPDAVLLTGGIDQGAEDGMIRLAHLVGQAALIWQARDPRRVADQVMLPVICAGNRKTADRVVEALNGKAAPIVVDNIRPTLEDEHLAPVRRELQKIYRERVLSQLPGKNELERLTRRDMLLASEAHGLMTRFVASRYSRNVLTVDVGATQTTAHIAEAQNDRYTLAIRSGIGVGYAASSTLIEAGSEAVQRWLPMPISDKDLLHHVLNTTLRPFAPPTTREELWIQLALAREALALTLHDLAEEHGKLNYDLVVATGSTLARTAHPGLAVLAVLDALQTTTKHGVLAIDLHLDTLGLFGAAGALSQVNPDAGMTVFERDFLNHTPLATCVVALGKGKIGDKALEAELHIVGGDKLTLTLAHGSIGRLALPPGRRAQLTIKPAGNVRIGPNDPGEVVSSEIAAIRGSALGVVIDARGRSIALPDNPTERRRLLWSWLMALGIEQESFPFASASDPKAPVAFAEMTAKSDVAPVDSISAEVVQPSAAPPTNRPRRISLAPPEPEPPPPSSIENDLAKLRQTVEEEPKKPGFFSRKK